MSEPERSGPEHLNTLVCKKILDRLVGEPVDYEDVRNTARVMPVSFFTNVAVENLTVTIEKLIRVVGKNDE